MDLSTRDGRRLQGEKLKQAAREAGITLDELARAIGCSRALIFQYASGASLAQTDRLQQIAAIVGKPLYWFFLTDEETHPAPSAEAEIGEREKQLREQLERVEADKLRSTERRIREDISHLELLLAAHSSAPDQRKIVECCQKLQPLVASLGDTESLASIMLKQGNAQIALQEWGPARECLQQAADLYLNAGKPANAKDCLQSMGHASLMLGRIQEALTLFETVADSTDWTNRWQGTLSIGAAREFMGDYSHAISAFEEALRIVEERSGAETEIPRLFVEANWANLELDFGDFKSARSRAAECGRSAQRNAVQDQYLEAQLTAGIADLHLGAAESAIARIRTALDLAQLTASKQYQALALACESLWMCAAGRAEVAIANGKEALAIALRSNVLRAEILAQRALCEAYLLADKASEALYHAEQGYAAARAHGVTHAASHFLILKGRCCLLAGDTDGALVTALDGLAQAEMMQVRPLIMEASLTLSQTSLLCGDPAGSLAHARKAANLAKEMELANYWAALAQEAFALHALDRDPEALAALQLCAELYRRQMHDTSQYHTDAAAENSTSEAMWRLFIELTYRLTGKLEAEQLAETLDWLPATDWLIEITHPGKGASRSGDKNA
jgi:transcriptional regulator with XRE-family HTH domain